MRPVNGKSGKFASRFGNFLACRDGAAALEFALVLPPLTLIIVGMFEVAMIMFCQTAVEGGLREAARFSITGQDTDGEGVGTTRQEQVIAIVDKHTLSMIDMSEAVFTATVLDSFDGIGQPEPWNDTNLNGEWDVAETYDDLNGNAVWDEERTDSGLSAEIVEYTIEYDWELMTPFIAQFIGTAGKLHMLSSITVRNEPWDVNS